VRSGFVAVVGRPNVGKSTLVNALVGTKVAITSPRPQTTRRTIRGVVTTGDAQIVLVDTPGMHRPRTALSIRLNEQVDATLADADAALLMLDATQPVGPGDRRLAGLVEGTPTVCVVNKVDRAGSALTAERLAEAEEWDLAAYVPVSALKGTNLEPVVEELIALLPEGPAYFPEGMPTDLPEEVLIAELVREKFLARLRDELPHSLAVVLADMSDEEGRLRIHADVVVERDSQKGIVIGKGGSMLRDAGTEARRDIERLLGRDVYLDLRVKVEKGWQDNPSLIERLGL
jgi:GTP-binding protein Era